MRRPCSRGCLCASAQIYLLNKRFSQQQQIIWFGRGGVQDRTIYEDSVFCSVSVVALVVLGGRHGTRAYARGCCPGSLQMLRDAGLMDPRDYDTYISLFNNMVRFAGFAV